MERFSADWWLKYFGVCIRPARPEDRYEELLPGVTTIPTGWDAHNKLSQQDIRKINNLVRSFEAVEGHKERQQSMRNAGQDLVQHKTSMPQRLLKCFRRSPKEKLNTPV